MSDNEISDEETCGNCDGPKPDGQDYCPPCDDARRNRPIDRPLEGSPSASMPF